MTRGAIALVVFAFGCTGSSASTDPRPQVESARPVAHPGRVVELPGDGNGVYWHASSSTLYVTDDTHGQLVAWTEANGVAVVGSFGVTGRRGFGALVRLDDGTFVTPSFGFGSDGAVLTYRDAAGSVPNLDRARRRIGLARTPAGALYVAYFIVEPGSKHRGGVAKLEPSGSETDLAIPGLGKPVGLAADASTLYIADQETATVLAYAVDGGKVSTVATGLPSADLLTLLPNGDLVTGGKKGGVYRIAKSGTVSTIASGFEQVRGTAYDAAGKRLFVVEHSASSSRHRLHVVPYDAR
jgi:sugar lactone lactonase YvrE